MKIPQGINQRISTLIVNKALQNNSDQQLKLAFLCNRSCRAHNKKKIIIARMREDIITKLSTYLSIFSLSNIYLNYLFTYLSPQLKSEVINSGFFISILPLSKKYCTVNLNSPIYIPIFKDDVCYTCAVLLISSVIKPQMIVKIIYLYLVLF